MLDLKSLQCFVEIVSSGSFRRAADNLGLAQASLSERIQRLEASLGTRLFDRDGRRRILSVRGEVLLPLAIKLLETAAQAEAEVSAPQMLRGTVRMGVSETIAQTLLPQIVATVAERYPLLSLEISVDISIHMREQLLNRQIDLAIMQGSVNRPGFAEHLLMSFPVSWVASPHLKLPGRRLLEADFHQYPVITFVRGTLPYEQIRHLFTSITDLQMHSCASISAMVAMAEQGMGLAALPRAVLESALHTGRLVELHVEPYLSPPPMAFSVAYARVAERPFAHLIAQLALTMVKENHTTATLISD